MALSFYLVLEDKTLLVDKIAEAFVDYNSDWEIVKADRLIVVVHIWIVANTDISWYLANFQSAINVVSSAKLIRVNFRVIAVVIDWYGVVKYVAAIVVIIGFD